MTADQATSDIIELVYHSAVVSDDPWVQEVHTSTAIRDILEEFSKDVVAESEYFVGRSELRRAQNDLENAEADNDSLREKVKELAERNSVLEDRLTAANELLGEYTGK